MQTPACGAMLIFSHYYAMVKQAVTLLYHHAGNQTLSIKFFIWPLTMQMGHFQLKLITPCLLKAMAFESSAH